MELAGKMNTFGRGLCMLACLSVLACDQEQTSQEVQDQIMQDAQFRSGDVDFCDQLYTFEHDIPVGDGAVLHVTERFSAASVLRLPRRAILMMPGTLVTGGMWDLEVDGSPDLNALDQAARAGYFAFAVTYEGYPGSSQPADGSTVTAERTLEQMGKIVNWIRVSHGVKKVDLMGVSIGSSLAIALGGDMSPISSSRIGRIVLQAVVYKEVTPLFEAVFFSPEVLALLQSAPNGYIMTAPEMYGLILAFADPAAAAAGFAEFPDVYATGPTLAGFDLPVFDAVHGVVPALQFWGTQDLITPYADVETFQSEYAGPNELRTLPGAGHAPYIAESELREAFWGETFEFLDYNPYTFYLACDPGQ